MTPITPKNILRHELIGLDAKVVKDGNPCNVSIHGRVIDESRNTLLLQQKKETKRIAKETATFRFKLPNGTSVDVNGSALVGRPEDRVKRKSKRGW